MLRQLRKKAGLAAARVAPVCAAAGCLGLVLLLSSAQPLPGKAGRSKALEASPEAIASARSAVEAIALKAFHRASSDSPSLEAWELMNHPQRLKAHLSSSGAWELEPLEEPLTAPSKGWRWRYQLSRITRGEAASLVEAPKVSGSEEQISLIRVGGMKEWYRNSRAGIEQGFEIPQRPLADSSGDLVLRGSIATDLLLVSSSDSHVEFGRAGAALLRYADLSVFDADGRRLPSRMSFAPADGGGELSLSVNDAGARYPLIVDPLTSSPLWTKAGDNFTQFGFSVASVGDVNGDGFADVVVGAPSYTNGASQEGAAYIFLGAASGPSTTPSIILEGGEASAAFGRSVASAGDVNGDGYSDLIVGAPDATGPCGSPSQGAAHVFLGSASGLSISPAWSTYLCLGDNYGASVSSAGDINNDGFSDVLVGCPRCTANIDLDGNAFLFLGAASGLSTNPAWSFNTDDSFPAQALFGSSVACAGDVNNDGYSDVLVGAEAWAGQGRAFLFKGSASGLPAAADWSSGFSGPTPAQVSAAGDTNKDGFDDILVGAPDIDSGIVRIFLGASSLSNDPSLTLAGTSFSAARFGASISSAGDINADGYDDILIGSPNFEVSGAQRGRTFLFLGSASGPQTIEAWISTGDQPGAAMANSVAAGGDINGDGYPDVIVGNSARSANAGWAAIWSDFNIERGPPPTPTPISIAPGVGGLPAPEVTTSGKTAVITAPRVVPKLSDKAKASAIKKLMRSKGLSKPQAIKALSKLVVTYIFTVKFDNGASGASIAADEAGAFASSITRRSKRNQVTLNNLPPGARVASYKIEISTRKPPFVLGTTKPSAGRRFTVPG